MKWNMLCTSINFNFKYHEIYIKTSFRTLRSLTFIKMWRVLISPVNSLQMPRNLKAFLLAQFKLRLQKTVPHRKLKNTTIDSEKPRGDEPIKYVCMYVYNNGLCCLMRVPLAVSRQKSEHVICIKRIFFCSGKSYNFGVT